MEYYELIFTFSKVDFNIFSGYYKSFLNWGIVMTPSAKQGDNSLRIEKCFCKEHNHALYDFELYLNGKRLILENDVETTKYIQCIYDALQKIDLLYKKGKN